MTNFKEILPGSSRTARTHPPPASSRFYGQTPEICYYSSACGREDENFCLYIDIFICDSQAKN